MKSVFVLGFVFAVCQALTPPPITGTTPPTVPCENKLCNKKADGNYEYIYHGKSNPSYFLQCSNGLAYCQPCWPLSLEFSPKCNQCLYKKTDECVTTQKWKPATTSFCPDKCPHRGIGHTGNIEDPYNPYHYIACWEGVTVGCIDCPAGLMYNEHWNACLYEGLYKTAPLEDTDEEYVKK